MPVFTIVRRRVVTQIMTDQVTAETQEEALEEINKLQRFQDYHDVNKWHDLDDAIDYPELDEEAILEVNDE